MADVWGQLSTRSACFVRPAPVRSSLRCSAACRALQLVCSRVRVGCACCNMRQVCAQCVLLVALGSCPVRRQQPAQRPSLATQPARLSVGRRCCGLQRLILSSAARLSWPIVRAAGSELHQCLRAIRCTCDWAAPSAGLLGRRFASSLPVCRVCVTIREGAGTGRALGVCVCVSVCARDCGELLCNGPRG
jgi:hypothetical protein